MPDKRGEGNATTMPDTFRQKLLKATARMRNAVRRRVPPGLRLPLGLVLIAFGILGFLPVLGFWMIPLGIAVAALDIRPAWRYLTGRRDR
jgi:hypothetical protein